MDSSHLPCGVVALNCASREDRRGISRRGAELQCPRRGEVAGHTSAARTRRHGHRRHAGDDTARVAGRPIAGALYVQDDPSLAGVLSESMADRIADKLGGKTVEAVLPKPLPDMATVKADDTIVEVAAIMAGNRSPLVVVMSGDGLVGVITASRLLEVALAKH